MPARSLSTRFVGLVLASLGLIDSPSHAQWSANAGVNLAIADLGNDQVQAKIKPTADGGCYISWFDNRTGGHDVYLQRLDYRGVEQWPHNGVLVANLTLSSTNDYGLDVDAAGNAVLAFQDDRFGGTKATVNLVSPAGVLLWGANGVQVTAGSAFSPRVAATTDGFYVAAWTEGSGIKIQKLNAAGVPQWAAGGINQAPGVGAYAIADLHAADLGTVIASFQYQPSGFSGPKYLWSQKYNTAGAPVWNTGTPVSVFDGTSLQFGNFPTFVSDSAGGAVYTWYETGGTRNAYVQHVNAAGTQLFAHNGIAVSTLTLGRIRFDPDVAYNPVTGDIFCAWTDSTSPNQNQWGVSAQKITSAGTLAWGGNAKTIIPLSPLQTAFVRCGATSDGGMVTFWFDRSGSAYVLGSGLDAAGNFTWIGDNISVCSVLSGKSRLALTMNACGNAFLAWGDARADAGNIYAQNVSAAGALGNPVIGDITGNGIVNIDDLLAVINAWGRCAGPAHCPPDIAPAPCGNNSINIDDLLAVINNWT